MFLNNQNSVLQQIQHLKQAAQNLKEIFNDRDVPILLDYTTLLENEYTKLYVLLPSDFSCNTELGRHIRFLFHYLKLNDKDSCRNDINQICDTDIDIIEKAYIDYMQSLQSLDSDIKNKILPLINNHHYPDAVRQSFIILAERLRKTFNASSDDDGKRLVDSIFAKTGLIQGKIPQKRQDSLRSLLEGLYATFRNDYAHNDKSIDLSEVLAVIYMINWMLQEIGNVKSEINSSNKT